VQPHRGQVFADPECPYTDAMQAFVAASPPRIAPALPPAVSAAPDRAAGRRCVRQAADRLRLERREVRQQRQAEDALWRRLWHQQHPSASTAADPTQPPSLAPLPPEVWRTLRQQRHDTLRQRAAQDVAWRAGGQHLREQLTPATAQRDWIAILVLTDNCTRQCYNLPLFTAGAEGHGRAGGGETL
jgi:hypothetical protein